MWGDSGASWGDSRGSESWKGAPGLSPSAETSAPSLERNEVVYASLSGLEVPARNYRALYDYTAQVSPREAQRGKVGTTQASIR